MTFRSRPWKDRARRNASSEPSIRQGTDIVHQSSRRVTLRAKSDGGMSERRVSFLDRAVLDPGEYEITAVLTSPEAETPFTARVRVAVPAVPRKVPFLVGPYLGYRAGRDVVIHIGIIQEVFIKDERWIEHENYGDEKTTKTVYAEAHKDAITI